MHEKGSVHYLEDFLSLSSCCVHVFVVGMDSMFVYDVYCDHTLCGDQCRFPVHL